MSLKLTLKKLWVFAPLILSYNHNAVAAPQQLGSTGEYFEFISTNESWDSAFADALTKHFNGVSGHLATIHNASENNFVAALIVASGGNSAWLGATDVVTGNVANWTWSDGAGFNCTIGDSTSCVGAYSNFYNGEPNNAGGGENSLQMYSSGTWNDLNSNNYGYDTPGYVVEYSVGAVPELSEMLLLISGLPLVVGLSRRKLGLAI
jgi:hypothetical protein